MNGRCKRCNKRLFKTESIARGYGTVCHMKYQRELYEQYLKMQLSIFDYDDKGLLLHK